MVQSDSLCLVVYDIAREGWDWGICNSTVCDEGCGRVDRPVASVRGPRTGALEKALQ